MKPLPIQWLLLFVLIPVIGFSQTEIEPNNSTSQATTLAYQTDIIGSIGDCNPVDNSTDYFAITPPFRGTMVIRTSISNDDPSSGVVNIDLLSNTGSLITDFDAQSGGNGSAIEDSLVVHCEGVNTYYIRVNSGGSSICTDYVLNYEMITTVYADDMEPNNSTSASDTVHANLDHEGTIDFRHGDNFDYYRLILPNDGVLNIHTEAEHAGPSTTDSLTLSLHNSSGSTLTSWRVPVGATSAFAPHDVSIDCRGNEQLYYLRIGSDACGVSYLFNYSVSTAVYADDVEPNGSTSQADTVSVDSLVQGRLDFYYDNNSDYYRLVLDEDGVLNIHTSVEHVSGSTTDSLTLTLYNSSGSTLTSWRVAIGASSIAASADVQVDCRGTENLYYLRLQSDVCGTSYQFSYDVTPPSFADDVEPNGSTSQADTVSVDSLVQGRLDFHYDNNSDYYRLVLDDDGVLNIHTSVEHVSGSTTDSLTLNLYNNSGSTITSWRVAIGASSIAATADVQVDCRGTENLYYLRLQSDACGTSYQFSYDVTPPLFADDVEPNQSTSQAIVATAGTNYEGRLDFYYDNDFDYYRLQAPNDGVMSVVIEAEHTSANATDSMDVYLRNSSGTVLEIFKVGIGANSSANSQTLARNCIGTEQVYYLEPYSQSSCGVSYRFNYTVASPLFSDDAEPNQSTSQAIVASAGTDYDGRLNFDYDNDFDYYRLQAPDDGILSVVIEAEHTSASITDSIDVYLRNSSGSVLQIFKVGIGPNGVANSQILSRNCIGTEQVYYLEPYSPSVCGVSYRFNYTVAQPVFADDIEPNQNTSQAVDIDLEMSDVDGRLEFNYDNNFDYFKINHSGGPIVLNTLAESAGSSGTMDIIIRNSSGSTLETAIIPVGGNSTPTANNYTSASYSAGDYYLEPNDPTICGVSYQFECYDDDDDGTCNFFDLCPGGPEPGTPCDDGTACTTNDVIQSDCSCSGTPVDPDDGNACTTDSCDPVLGVINAAIDPDDGDPCTLDSCDPITGVSNIFQDSDNDGTCDANDLCPGGPEPGTACDDSDATTGNDVILSDCSCAGQLIDCEGVIGGSALPGTSCDDGDPNTSNDVYDANCNCGGQALDCEGVPGGSALPGTACDDGDATTGNDVYDANCSCAGQLIDCEGTAGGTALPGTACDDGDPNTSNDVYDANCNCGGQSLDCEGVPGGSALPGTACDDGDATTGNDVYDANCNCAGQLIDCEGTAGGTALPGTSCDDGDPNTSNDVYDANCNCAGQALDCEGVPGGSALPGSPCDDGDATTGNDVYLGDCTCVGQVIDCEGLAGGTALPGTACDDADPNTTGDVYDANCNCTGTPIGSGTNNLSLVISTDDNGSETSWEILPAGSSTAVCSGAGYPDNQVSVENCNIADGCYELRVYDSMGDGMFSGSMGGYVLHDQFGGVLIDNEGDGQFGALSAITNNNTFCVPMGSDKLRFADCGKLDLLPSDFIIATNNPAVAAEYGVGAQNDDGFQYWVFDPDGTYSRFIFLSHANHSIGAPSGAYAVNHLKLTSMASSPVPVNIKLNVKIRSRVNGVNSAFGPACVIMIDVAAAGCPMTNLIDDPSSPFFACGVSKTFGGSDKVRAIPVPGANKYQFRFENVSEGYLRHIAFPSYTCKLRWGTLPLSIGVSYDVQVRISYDSGTNYCPWGAVCSVTIIPSPTVSSRELANEVHNSVSVYPNPSDGSFINLMISVSDEEMQSAQIQITDMSGKTVHSSQFTVYQGGQSESLELDHSLSKGTYLLHIRIGNDLFSEILIVN